MEMIIFLMLAILLGAFMSSVAFGFIARGLGFKPSDKSNPVYRTTADFMTQSNPKVVSSGFNVQLANSQLVYHSYDPSTSKYYSIVSKEYSAHSTILQQRLKTRKYETGRKRYLVPVNEPLKED